MKEIVAGVLAGVLTAVLVILVLLTISTLFQMQEDQQYHTTNITVAGKICNDDVLGSPVSKIQGDDGLIYFIPNPDCELYPIGRHGMIFYTHICNLPYCFNRTVGDYP
jgi:hypothetical protein